MERYALLVRGQSLRWGCGEQGVFLQRLCVLSQLEMLVKPLRIAGHSVDTFIFAFDHPAAGCNRSHALALDELLPVGQEPMMSRSQGGAFRQIINRFAAKFAAHTFDFLIFTRFDQSPGATL